MSEELSVSAPQKKAYPIEFDLPSGKKASIRAFKGKDAMMAQRQAGTDGDKYLPILIAMTTTVDGNPIVFEDLEEMDGADYLSLLGEFSQGAF